MAVIRIVAGAFALLVLLPETSSAVDLSFGWKPGLSCRVKSRGVKSGVASPPISFTLKVSALPDGKMLIETLDAQLDSQNAEEQKMFASLKPHLTALALPAFHIDGQGAFQGLHDLAGTRKSIAVLMDAILPKDADPAVRKRTLDMMQSEALLESMPHLLWDPAVTNWVGSSWEVNQKVSGSSEQSFPIGNVQYTADFTAIYHGNRPCHQGQTTAACAYLTTEQVPEAEFLDKVMGSLIGLFGGDAAKVMQEVKFEKVDFQVRTETLTHPETLVPVRVVLDKAMTFRFSVKGVSQDQARQERYEWDFDCPE